MSNPLKRVFHQFLQFSRSDRNAILILAALIVMVVITNIVIHKLEQKPSFDMEMYEEVMSDWRQQSKEDQHSGSLFLFNPNKISKKSLDSLLLPEFIKRNIVNYRNAGGKFNSSNDVRKIYGMTDSIYQEIKPYLKFDVIKKEESKVVKSKVTTKKEYFDPNIAEFNKLKKIGFNNYQANNVIKYRNKGGVFKTASDLKKIYGVDSVFFSTISEYVLITDTYNDSIALKKKFFIIELNTADSSELVKLYGVGSVFATRIIKYRDLLGGFYKKNQLLEVYGFPEETFVKIKDQLSIDTTLINKIRINFAEYSDLLRHPYLNKKQVKVLIDYRTKNGAILNLSENQWDELLGSGEFKRIQPYLNLR